MSGYELPQPTDLVGASLLVGILFLVRFVLGVRRILLDGDPSRPLALQTLRDATQPLAFGREFEPNRRHAVRQFFVGAFFLALGLLLLGWAALSALG